MDNNINLDNNYYLKIVNNVDKTQKNIINIENLKLKSLKKKENILLEINFQTLHKNKYKKILKNLMHIIRIMKKTKFGLKEENQTLLGYVINYNEKNKQQNEFILAINAIFYDKRYERYNYIYDTVCNYLDGHFYGKNLCDFKDNRCVNGQASTLVGCCKHFKHKWLGPISKLVICEHLKEDDKTCSAKCISCKLFTCDYLQKKGIKFRIKDILLLDIFFNPIQKYFIKTMVFTPKEKIIKRLMIT